MAAKLEAGSIYSVNTSRGDFVGVCICQTRDRVDFRILEGSVSLRNAHHGPGDVISVPLTCDIVEMKNG